MKRIAVLTALTFSMLACSRGVKGTYSIEGGAVMLELRSGGDASLTMLNDVAPCTYTVNGNQLTLDCKQLDRVIFTIHDDGSLTGPPGSMMGALRKTKS